MRILGIDPGIGITGWGLVELINNSKPILQSAGIIKTEPNAPTPLRAVRLYNEITKLLNKLKPNQIAVERLFFNRNITTAMKVSEARGVILLAIGQAKIDFFEYMPLQIKMAIVGYGRATKHQIFQMLPQHIQGAPIPKQDDAADAIAIAVTHSIVRN